MFYKEDYISLDTAKLLKEKGFDEYCEYFYKENEYTNRETFYPKVTLYEVQKWIRKKYQCHIQIITEFYTNGINYLFQVLFYDENSYDCISDISSGLYGDNGEYKTYEECLDAAIREALKRI